METHTEGTTGDTMMVTEFQLKRVFLSLTLMDEGQTNNPNVTPISYPMKFWGLLAMVAPIAHISYQRNQL